MGACSIIVSPAVFALTGAAPDLRSSASISTAGYFNLTWSASTAQDAQPRQYELQQANSQAFSNPVTIYSGPDEATVISGRPDQVYFFRVRETGGGAWSAPVEVEVKHHSLTRAVGFFALGALMFIIMISALINGARGRQ